MMQQISEMYFVPVITFLVASLCDLIGRVLAAKFKQVSYYFFGNQLVVTTHLQPNNQLVIMAVSLLRLSFLPLLVLSNAQPRRRLPVLFNDVAYIMFTMAFSFTNGYLINLCVTLIPKMYVKLLF